MIIWYWRTPWCYWRSISKYVSSFDHQKSSVAPSDFLRLKIFLNWLQLNLSDKHTTTGLIAKNLSYMLESNCIIILLRLRESSWRKVCIPCIVEWILYHETSLQEWKLAIPKIPNKWKTILKWFVTHKSFSQWFNSLKVFLSYCPFKL